MSRTTIDLIVVATINGKETEVEVSMPTSEDELKEALLEKFDSEKDEDDETDVGINDINFVVSHWGEAEDYKNLQDLEKVFDINNSNINADIEVISAGVECGISVDSIDEAYQGEANSDEDFVQELLESTGDIPSSLPSYVHIDWESTARDIMMDYSETNGHYFRM